MTYNKNSIAQVEPVNLTATIASRSEPVTGLAGVQNTFRTADGVTRNEWEFPDCAPLIFPGLDQLGGQTSDSAVKEQTKMKKSMAFVTDYWDKRATAAFVSSRQFFLTYGSFQLITKRLWQTQIPHSPKSLKESSSLDTPTRRTPLPADH